MLKWLKNILTAVIIASLIWYLYQHWDSLKELLQLSRGELAAIYAISFVGALCSGFTIQYMLSVLNIKAGFIDMAILQNAMYLLSYVPMKFSAVFRAGYMKRHYGLSYAQFGMFYAYLTVIMLAAATAIALTVLITIYGLDSYEQKVVAIAFSIMLAACLLFAFIPLPIPAGGNKITDSLRSFLMVRHRLAVNKKAILIATGTLALNFVLASVRLGIIYYAMGLKVHPAGFLVLGAIGYFTLFINITPGALGMRELVLGSAATVINLPLQVGILAAMIDRAVALSYSFVVGGICSLWLWRKMPTDFKETSGQ